MFLISCSDILAVGSISADEDRGGGDDNIIVLFISIITGSSHRSTL